MDDSGEPISTGQRDRRASETRALADALFAIALFTGVVIVNVVIVFLAIALLQAIGGWETTFVDEETRELNGVLLGRASAGP
jgi:hypothetical protein